MRAIWGTNYSRLPGLIVVVQAAVADTHVQPVGHVSQVGDVAGGAHVRAVIVGMFSSLQRPDRASRSMSVIDSHGGLRGELLVGAEHAPGRAAGHVDLD